MVDLSKVSGFVQKFVEEVNMSDGNLERLSKAEFNKLSEYLANNSDLKTEDKEFIQGYMIEHTSNKDLRKWTAQGNKTTEKSNQSYSLDDLSKALGKNSPFLKQYETGDGKQANILELSGLIVTLENGQYSIEKLVDFVDKAINESDYILNRNNAEIEAVRDKLSEYVAQTIGDEAKQTITEVSNKDIKRLAKFVGFNIGNKNIIKKMYESMINSVAAAANVPDKI